MVRSSRRRASSAVARSSLEPVIKVVTTWKGVRASPLNPRVATKARAYLKPRPATRVRASTARARSSITLRGSQTHEPQRTHDIARAVIPPRKTKSRKRTAEVMPATEVQPSRAKRPVGRSRKVPAGDEHSLVLPKCTVQVSPLRSARKVFKQRLPCNVPEAPPRNPLRAIGFHDNSRAIEDACANGGADIVGMSAEEVIEIQLELEDIVKRLSRRKALLKEHVEAVSRAQSMEQYMGKANVGETFNEPVGKPRDPKPALEEHAVGIPLHRLVAQKRLHSNRPNRGKQQASSAPKVDGEMSGEKSKKAAKPRESQKTHQNIVHKFEVPEKFWKFVEPYCGPITREHLEYLDQLLKGNEYSAQLLKFSVMLEKHRASKRLGDTREEEEEDTNAEAPRLSDSEKELIRRMGITPEVYNRLRRSNQRAASRQLSQQSPNRQQAGSSPSPNVASANGDATDNSIAMNTRGHASTSRPSRSSGPDRRPKNPLNGEAASENHDPDDQVEEDWHPAAEKLEMLQKVNRKIIEYVRKHVAVQLEKQEIFRRLDEIDAAREKALGKVSGIPGKEVILDPTKWNKELDQRLCRERSELMRKLRKAHEQCKRLAAEPFPMIPSEICAMLHVPTGTKTSRAAMAGPSTSAASTSGESPRRGTAVAKETSKKSKAHSHRSKKPKSSSSSSSAFSSTVGSSRGAHSASSSTTSGSSSSSLSLVSASSSHSRKRKARN